jgi:hypothetical protein
MVMPVPGGTTVLIASELQIRGDLVRPEHELGFKIRCEMYRSQPTLQFGYCSSLGGQPIGTDLALLK